MQGIPARTGNGAGFAKRAGLPHLIAGPGKEWARSQDRLVDEKRPGRQGYVYAAANTVTLEKPALPVARSVWGCQLAEAMLK